MNTNFLLKSKTAKLLYETVKDLPVTDYHNHLSIKDISENKRYLDIYDLWIAPDPYKHRAMRMCGVKEELITGNAPVWEKFKAWCETLPKLIGHPIYIWSKMELYEVFGIMELPCKENAQKLYENLNSFLESNEITPKYLLDKFRIEYACPCTSLIDDISIFDNFPNLAPSLRGDDITAPDIKFINNLEKLTHKINNLCDFKNALSKRLEIFKKSGCRFTDHALDNGFKYYPDDGDNETRFEKVISGEPLSFEDSAKLFSDILTFLSGEYARLGFTVQLHIGAQRYTSTRLRTLAGAAGGFAGIGNSLDISSFTFMLDVFEKNEYGLPKMILFTLNPSDNALLSVLSGSFSKDGVSGLITQGPAWWWCDHKYGIETMLENASGFGLLSNFAGMTTDSRSFLSMVRHDYFRRILCDFLAAKYENDELMCSIDELKKLIIGICYKNSYMKG